MSAQGKCLDCGAMLPAGFDYCQDAPRTPDPRDRALGLAEKALERAKWWNGTNGEDANAAFERIAETFRRDTGFIRPGKSQPMEMVRSDEDRRNAWNVWIAGKQEQLCESIAEALAAIREAKQ